jgi:hypothetical protein
LSRGTAGPWRISSFLPPPFACKSRIATDTDAKHAAMASKYGCIFRARSGRGVLTQFRITVLQRSAKERKGKIASQERKSPRANGAKQTADEMAVELAG